MPGFGPAAEPLLFRKKWPKPMTPCLATSNRADVNLRRADQLARLKQGLPANKSVRPKPVSRRQGKGVKGEGIDATHIPTPFYPRSQALARLMSRSCLSRCPPLDWNAEHHGASYTFPSTESNLASHTRYISTRRRQFGQLRLVV